MNLPQNYTIFRKVKDTKVEIAEIYFLGSILQSLKKIFGEIGGHTTVDLLKYEHNKNRGIIRVPSDYYVKLRTAITLTGQFQDTPCAFIVHKASPILLSLVASTFDLE